MFPFYPFWHFFNNFEISTALRIATICWNNPNFWFNHLFLLFHLTENKAQSVMKGDVPASLPPRPPPSVQHPTVQDHIASLNKSIGEQEFLWLWWNNALVAEMAVLWEVTSRQWLTFFGSFIKLSRAKSEIFLKLLLQQFKRFITEASGNSQVREH